MKRNYLIGAAIAVVVLGLFFLIFRHFFEISPVTRYLPPSREARVNEYLALDRWLSGMGIPLRVETSGDFFMVSRAKEKKIFIQASHFFWTDEAVNYLAAWVEDGGTLVLVLDYPVGWQEEEPMVLLEGFGIIPERAFPRRDYDNVMERTNYYIGFSFEISDEALSEGEILTLRDRNGISRFAQVKRGKGKIVALGESNFLRSSSLDDESNIRLAWALFASDFDPNENAWLFIRGKTAARGLLGTIFRQGNFTVLLVSLFVLLFVCFWAVIPGFGLVRWDEEKSSRPLRERFLAEGRFFKRFGALDVYSQAYVRAIKRRLTVREGIMGDEESLKRVLEIYEGMYGIPSGKAEDEKESRLFDKAFRKEKFTFREFPMLINALKTVLERI